MKVRFFDSLRDRSARGAATALMTILLLAALPVTQVYAAAGAVTVTVGAQTGTLTYGGAGTADFVVTVVQAGQTSPSILLDVTGLPSGVTATWDTNPVAGAHSPGTTTTLHLATNGTPVWAAPGTYNFTVTNSIDANTGSGSLTIGTKPLTVTATGEDKVYDGTTEASVTLDDDRVPGDDVTTDYTSATFADMNVNIGIAVDVAGISITGGADASRYTLANTTASTSADITKATASIDVTPYDVIYDGTEQIATGTATGVEPIPADLSSLLDLTGTAHTGAGTYTGDMWTFAGDDNYFSDSGTVDDNIAKADALISITPYDVTYDGTEHVATGTAAGVEASPVDLSSLLDLTATAHTGAGSYTVDAWTFAGNANYNSASGTVDDNIAKANAIIDVTGYNVVYDGAQHVATGTATGVEASPADLSSLLDLTATAHTDVGNYVGDAWTFAGDANYNSASGTVDNVIVAAVPLFEPSPASWNFSIVKVGTTSVGKSFVITNGGNADLVITSVSLTGPNSGQFLIKTASPCAAAIPPAGSCTVAVAFKPTSTGSKTAALSFTDNAGNHDIALSGKGGANLLLNGTLDTYPNLTARIPMYWTATNFSATDGKNTLIKKGGPASVQVTNTSAIVKTLVESRTVTGHAGDTLMLVAWARGKNIPTTAGLVRAQVLLYNGTTLLQKKSVNFPTDTYAFTQRNVVFTASGAYTRVVVKLIYSKGGGTVWFDSVSLLRSQ